jgi:hypothetical protein
MHQLESDLWIGPANRTWKKECQLLYVYLFCEWKFSKSNLLYFVTKISVKSQKTQDQGPKKAGKKIKSNEKLVETAGETADETTAAEETAEEETEFEEDPGNQHLVHSEVMSENYKSNKLESVFLTNNFLYSKDNYFWFWFVY